MGKKIDQFIMMLTIKALISSINRKRKKAVQISMCKDKTTMSAILRTTNSILSSKKRFIQNRKRVWKDRKQTSNVSYTTGNNFNLYFKQLLHIGLGNSKNSGSSKQQFL